MLGKKGFVSRVNRGVDAALQPGEQRLAAVYVRGQGGNMALVSLLGPMVAQPFIVAATDRRLAVVEHGTAQRRPQPADRGDTPRSGAGERSQTQGCSPKDLVLAGRSEHGLVPHRSRVEAGSSRVGRRAGLVRAPGGTTAELRWTGTPPPVVAVHLPTQPACPGQATPPAEPPAPPRH